MKSQTRFCLESGIATSCEGGVCHETASLRTAEIRRGIVQKKATKLRHLRRGICDYEVVTGEGDSVGCIQAAGCVDANEAYRLDSASCDRAIGRIEVVALVRRQIRALHKNESSFRAHMASCRGAITAGLTPRRVLAIIDKCATKLQKRWTW